MRRRPVTMYGNHRPDRLNTAKRPGPGPNTVDRIAQTAAHRGGCPLPPGERRPPSRRRRLRRRPAITGGLLRASGRRSIMRPEPVIGGTLGCVVHNGPMDVSRLAAGIAVGIVAGLSLGCGGTSSGMEAIDAVGPVSNSTGTCITSTSLGIQSGANLLCLDHRIAKMGTCVKIGAATPAVNDSGRLLFPGGLVAVLPQRKCAAPTP